MWLGFCITKPTVRLRIAIVSEEASEDAEGEEVVSEEAEAASEAESEAAEDAA